MQQVKSKNKLPQWLRGKCLQLTYSNHSLDRLEERCNGCLMLKPTFVKLTENNVIKWYKNEERKVRVKVKINYSRKEDLILIIQLDGTVRTLYYENRRKIIRPANKFSFKETQHNNTGDS